MTVVIIDTETTGLEPLTSYSKDRYSGVRTKKGEAAQIVSIGCKQINEITDRTESSYKCFFNPKIFDRTDIETDERLKPYNPTYNIKTYETEENMLSEFWTYLNDEVDKPIISGFNFDFDWKFLKLRSLLHNIKITRFDKYTNQRIDIRERLNSNTFQSGTTLHDYCDFLGISYIDDDFTGKDMPQYYTDRRYTDIIVHQMNDVKITAELYMRMCKCNLL